MSLMKPKVMRVVSGTDVFDLVEGLSERGRQVAEALRDSEIAWRAALTIDRHRLGSGPPPEERPILGATRMLERPEVMESMDLSLLFIRHDGAVYVKVGARKRAWDDLLGEVAYLEDHYWPEEDTDPRGIVAVDEWQQRERTWLALGDLSSRRLRALHWRASGAGPRTTPLPALPVAPRQLVEAIMAAMPTPYERARNLMRAEAAEQARLRGETAADKAATSDADPDPSVVAACALTPITVADLMGS